MQFCSPDNASIKGSGTRTYRGPTAETASHAIDKLPWLVIMDDGHKSSDEIQLVVPAFE